MQISCLHGLAAKSFVFAVHKILIPCSRVILVKNIKPGALVSTKDREKQAWEDMARF